MSNDLVIPTIEHQYEQTKDSQPPRAKLVQSSSREVRTKVCQAGDIIHSITEEILSDKVIPLLHFITYVRFNAENPRSRGWSPDHEPNSLIYKFRSALDVPNGELEWTYDENTGRESIPPLCNITDNMLCYVRGQRLPVLFSFSKSSARVGKEFVEKYKAFPVLSKLFSITSELTKDQKAYKYKVTVLKEGITQEDIDIAATMYKAFKTKIDEVATHDAEEKSEEVPF